MPVELREVLAELAAGGADIRTPEDLETALAARPDLRAKLETLAQSTAGGPSIPSEFADDLRQAQQGEQRYLRTGGQGGLDAAAAGWERIVRHPTFPASDERFQLVTLNNAGCVFLRRYWAMGRSTQWTRLVILKGCARSSTTIRRTL